MIEEKVLTNYENPVECTHINSFQSIVMENTVIVCRSDDDRLIDFDFSHIHYYYNVSPFVPPKERPMLMIWIGEKKTITETGEFLVDTEDIDSPTYFKDYNEEKCDILGVVQFSMENDSCVALHYLSVSTEHREKGFSKKMISDFIDMLKKDHPGKELRRTRPSEMGEKYLNNNFTQALNVANIKWSRGE